MTLRTYTAPKYASRTLKEMRERWPDKRFSVVPLTALL
jgi:hypothetical protein